MASSHKPRQGKADAGYFRQVLERARDIRESDAFEAPPTRNGETSLVEVRREVRASNRRNLKVALVLVAATLVVIAFSLCLPFYGVDASTTGEVYDPRGVADCWWTCVYLNVGPLFDGTINTHADEIMAALQARWPNITYSLVIDRGAATLAIIACGCLLAVSGMLFQTAFRNPIATPSMLGVSDGVTLGIIIYVLLGNLSMSSDPGLYMGLVYGCGVLTLVVVLLLSRVISGGRTYNVFDMLLIGTVITQILSGVNSHVTNFIMEPTTWDTFYDVQQGFDTLREPLTYQIVAIFTVLTLVPALLLRFRLNMLAFDDGDARLSGVRPGLLRAFALVLGSAMQLAAIASIGQVAMLSLVVPFLVRYLLPSDTRFQMVGNVFLGMIVLLVCYIAQHFIQFSGIPIAIGTIVGVLVVPLLLWMIALQRRGWE